MSEISKKIGSRLRFHRNHIGLSQEELAEKSGLHNTYIGQLERGEKNATLETIEKITCALNISFEVLFENIAIGNKEDKTANECYDIITSLSLCEQRAVLDILKKLVEYKKL